MDISPSICLLIKGFKVDVKTDSVVQSEWSFGEANANNTRMPYWWAMAEKRGKDRVILKMIGAYEKGLYSEVVADEWKKQFINLSARITLLRRTIMFAAFGFLFNMLTVFALSLINICRCRRYALCRSRWSPSH